jgi:hypothetical protein
MCQVERATRGRDTAFVGNGMSALEPFGYRRQRVGPHWADAGNGSDRPWRVLQECIQHRTCGFADGQDIDIRGSLQRVDDHCIGYSSTDKLAGIRGMNRCMQDLLQLVSKILDGTGQ